MASIDGAVQVSERRKKHCIIWVTFPTHHKVRSTACEKSPNPRIVVESKSNTSMHLIHVAVARVARLKDLHAHPADVCPAARTSHVVAPFCLLDRRRALGTVPDVEFPFQFLEGRAAAGRNVFVLGTRVVAVSGVARRAKPLEAIRTGVRGGPHRVCGRTGGSAPVHVTTIRGRTVPKGVRVALDVCFKGRFEKIVKGGRGDMALQFL